MPSSIYGEGVDVVSWLIYYQRNKRKTDDTSQHHEGCSSVCMHLGGLQTHFNTDLSCASPWVASCIWSKVSSKRWRATAFEKRLPKSEPTWSEQAVTSLYALIPVPLEFPSSCNAGCGRLWSRLPLRMGGDGALQAPTVSTPLTPAAATVVSFGVGCDCQSELGPGNPVLRLPEYTRGTADFDSAHKGAELMAKGCIKAIRNLHAHRADVLISTGYALEMLGSHAEMLLGDRRIRSPRGFCSGLSQGGLIIPGCFLSSVRCSGEISRRQP